MAGLNGAGFAISAQAASYGVIMNTRKRNERGMWYPIETAPKDGTAVELRDDRYLSVGPFRVCWSQAHKGWIATVRGKQYKLKHEYTEWRRPSDVQ